MSADRRFLYRCLFLDEANQIVAFEDIPVDTAVSAIEWAETALSARQHHHGVEVWQGGRRIYPVSVAA